jgi:hypothetical protein
MSTVGDQFCRCFILELRVHANEPRAYNLICIDLGQELDHLRRVTQQLLLPDGGPALAGIAGTEPVDVVSGSPLGVVLGLVSGVVVDAGDVEVVARAGPARREIGVELGDCLLDRGNDFGVRRRPAGPDVVGAVVESLGKLQKCDRAAGVFDIGEVERVVGVHWDEYP